MVKIGIFALLFCVSLYSTYSYEQYFTFYSGTNFTGDSYTFKSKHPDASNLAFFVANSKSIQNRGYWDSFTAINYTGSQIVFLRGDTVGQNPSWSHGPGWSGSIRHGGVLETSEQSISFYSDTLLGGVENVVKIGANDIGFSPKSILTTGYSIWTLFSEANFEGNATCYISNRENHYLGTLNATLSNVRSLTKSCLGRIDTYLYAEDFYVHRSEEINIADTAKLITNVL